MDERQKLKKTLLSKIDHLRNEIDKLDNYIATGSNVDYKVCYTRKNELQQRMQDLEEINAICVVRNRY